MTWGIAYAKSMEEQVPAVAWLPQHCAEPASVSSARKPLNSAA
jgi:hypothetical protein